MPRLFIPGATMDQPFEIPKAEFSKLHDVLRLRSGAQVGIMPNDGTFWVCELDGRLAVPLACHVVSTEPQLVLTVAQGLPKGDKLDDVLRTCTEIGVSHFIVFPSDRSVVRWDTSKFEEKRRRLEAVVREAAETSFRMLIPMVSFATSLEAVLRVESEFAVLSELESEAQKLSQIGDKMTVVVGPEGGWSPREVQQIGTKGVTLGPRVLRTEHAGAAAAAVLLLR
jgi:16S rRNA (uracil1498-N3)-methyltransferase